MTLNNANSNSVIDNEKGYTLQLSVLPVAIIVLIILGAAFFLMSGEFDLPSFKQSGTEVTRIDGYPTTVYTNETMEKQRIVIKSQEELEAFLTLIDPSRLYTPEISGVDFSKTYLIGVATDTNEESGTVLRVKRVIENKEDNTLTISIEEIKPGENCPVDVQRNISVDIIALRITDKKIDFDKVTKHDEACDNEEDTESEGVEDAEVTDAETTESAPTQ